MKHTIRIVSLLLGILLLTGCASDAIPAKNLTDNVAALDITTEAADDLSPIGALGLKLLDSAVKSGDKNPVISPLSAYICLAMAMNGADKATLSAFESLMGADTEYVNLICRTAADMLSSIGNGTELSLACSAWVDDAALINEEYLQAIATNMEADVFQADLSTADAIKAINGWVNARTNGLIPVLHEQPYQDSIMLVLLNALYMNAEWEQPFMGYSTFDSSFTTGDGKTEQTSFMRMTSDIRCIRMEGAYGALLPYKDGRLAFIALLPESGSAGELLSRITQEQLHQAILSAEYELAFLKLPKFDFSYERLMTDDLAALGLEDAFDPDRADFTPTGRGPTGELYISSVFQKVRIQVNEEGTQAAAVTEIAEAAGAALIDPTELCFDRPFIYAVVDTETGVPLFLGTYDSPAK